MWGTSAASAEDAGRMRAMLVDCIGGPGRGDAPPPTSLTREQTAAVVTIYMRHIHEIQIAHDAGYVPTPEKAALATQRQTPHAERIAGCFRKRYDLPVEAAQFLRTDWRNVPRDPAISAVLNNMGVQ